MINLTELIEQANELLPLPASTVRLAELAGNPECELADVAELVAFDPVLTMKLLRAANSAASGSATPVGNVRDAVMRMGTAQVLAFAVAAGARPFLQVRVPGYGLGEGALWRHSIAAAVAVETLQASGVAVPADAFTAALLHDVGKLVMGRFLSPEILGFIQRAQVSEHLSQMEAESLLLGIHHGELGGLIAQHWKLPPTVVHGIIWHHCPEQGAAAICDLTYLANQLAWQIEAGLDGKKHPFCVYPGVATRLGVSQDKLDAFGPKAVARYTQVCHRYNAV